VLPFIRSVVDAAATLVGPDGRRASSRWSYRCVGEHHGIDDAVYSGVEDALRRLATLEPQETLALIRPLAASDAEEFRFLESTPGRHCGSPRRSPNSPERSDACTRRGESVHDLATQQRPASIEQIRRVERTDVLGGLIHEYRHAA
jgi:hypothetical protein